MNAADRLLGFESQRVRAAGPLSTEEFLRIARERLAFTVAWQTDPKNRRALRAWATEHMVGGWVAYEAVEARLVREVEIGLARVEGKLVEERKVHAWALLEGEVETSLLDTLGASVPRREGESEMDYGARLTRAAHAVRGRLDASARTLLTPLAPAHARVQETAHLSDERPTPDGVTSDAPSDTVSEAVPSEAELAEPSRSRWLRDLTALRAARGATVTEEERTTLGARKLHRRVDEERKRRARP